MDEQKPNKLCSSEITALTSSVPTTLTTTTPLGTRTSTPSLSVTTNNNNTSGSDSAGTLGHGASSNYFNKICYPDNITVTNNNVVYVKKTKLRLVSSHLEKIYVFFGIKLNDIDNHVDDCRTTEFLAYHIFCDKTDVDLVDVTKRVQNYINSLNEAEDSSYDSDCDADDQCSSGTTTTASHSNVSRTVSDTLGQEFAEYVGQPIQQDRSPGYITRVEFALKLGYTERLVQAALARLGPNPGQNELLAELIKLGAQQGADFSLDSPNSEISTSYQGSFSNSDDNPSSLSSSSELRPIVVDGSNVAMSHGNKEVFSCRGIKLCVDWFKNRGHKDITVFVPKWRKESSRPENPIKDQDILNDLERERMLVFTPSRLVCGKRLVCYDDRYILKLAAENDGVVVSNDNYRDLVQESCEFKKVVEERVLMYSFVNDRFMPPDDPLGRSGPTLENFLRITHKKGDPPLTCPYGKKCTYGNKCKYFHPERGLGPQKSVTEKLSEYAARQLQARNDNLPNRQSLQGKSLSVPLSSSGETSPSSECKKRLISRTKSGAPDCSPTVSFSPASIIEHGKYIGTQSIPLKQWGDCHKYDCQSFPKSHSIENISREISCGNPQQQQQQLGSNPNYVSSLWAHNATVQQQNQKNESPCGGGSDNGDGGANLHRKLQRQLTLNPAGCDPRIYQMQRIGQQQAPQPQQPPASQINQQHSPHRPLAPSLSGPRNHHPAHWNEIHQNVQRIASAPDPSRPWHSGPPPASSSEPQINLWPQCHMQQQQHQQSTTTQDQRRRLHYHLASIFPEDQVKSVMQMYPDETNPQKICAAILNMYPKM